MNGYFNKSQLLSITAELGRPHAGCLMESQRRLCPFLASMCYLPALFLATTNTNTASQPFWGTMVHAAGAGPMPIPQKMLNSQNLSQAIQYCLTPSALAAARGMAEKMRQESGVNQAVNSFHANLPLDKIRCDIMPTLPAAWSYKMGSQHLKLSKEAAEILTVSRRVKWVDLKR